jgi:phospholipase C
VMENHDWSSIKGSASAPYINGTLLVQGAHAENYQNVNNLHPSEPNYIFLESGSSQGVLDDGPPSSHLLTAPHLTGLLNAAGVSWKSYQEDISGTSCPLTTAGKYFPKHNPAIYFKDINGSLNASSSLCISHVRPYTELQADLDADTVPAYSFITPNICNDMHDNTGCQSTNAIANGDGWLSQAVPKIMASKAFQDGGAIFITWDESEGGNVPIGMIVLSPFAKAGYAGRVAYNHASTLRTLQEILGVTTPFLGAAEAASDLSDLFRTFP